MKPSLHLKIAVLLAHVLLCTYLVLAAHQADSSFGTDAADSAAMRQQADMAAR